jgi:uncharacterized protein YidB (DUF937 family)
MGLLGNDLGGGFGQRRGMSPLTMALLGLLAYRTFQGKGRLDEMFGQLPSTSGNLGEQNGPPQPASGPSGLLGGIFSGMSGGGFLSEGLRDLLGQFKLNGQGEKAQSWISKGPNEPVAPNQLEQALGPERIDWLMRETGLSRSELLEGLSKELPSAVDQLTPEGRIPTEEEMTRLASVQNRT